MPILLLIAILVVLIVVHELGHFIAAKLLRVKVEEFGVGYPPRAFTFGKWGATEYTLNWLPFGGFVRLLEEDGPEGPVQWRRAGSFAAASRPRQIAVLLAGVVMNALFGWLLFTAGFMVGTPAVVLEPTPNTSLVVSAIVPGSPAFDADIQPGDIVISVTDSRKENTAERTPVGISNFVSDRGGRTLILTYERKGTVREARIIPAHGILPDKPSQAALGMGLALVSEHALPLPGAMAAAFTQSWQALKTACAGIIRLAHDALFWRADIRTLIGPVGLTGAVSDAASHGFGQLLALAGLISFNLVVINLLPIPALDGGRLVFVAVEAARRRRVPFAVARAFNVAGFALIILLMLAVTYNDFARILH